MRFGLTRWNQPAVSKWGPFEEMSRMQERMNQLFSSMGTGSEMMDMDTLSPLVDIKEEEDKVVVTTDLPGVDKKDINIDIRDDKLWISANTHKESEEKEEGYYMRERTYSRFARAFNLPTAVTEEGANAKLEDGVLTITMPKSHIEEKHKIMIE
ncbi:Hsp20/alpha crystallin family protein [Methanolobus sp. ZRKC3]|uniref:Hsp20/alpha crystallin family protein n=1 Tax=Methanolobus sp. ZRKC3 TaxID=3125786 RepID=UPI00324D389F